MIKKRKVTHLLVTANDITRQVKLERELKDSERRVQDQMTMMVHILQADPIALQDYLDSAGTGLETINDILRTSNPRAGLTSADMDAIMRQTHQLKGDAAALQLESLAQSLHTLETLLQGLRNQSERKGEDLLPVAVRVKSLFGEITSVQDVISRISQIRGGPVSVEPPKPARNTGVEIKAFARQWSNYAQQLAGRQDKQVALSYQGMDLDELAAPVRETLNSMVNQFIRNALVHGVETPAERQQRGKPETAHISVYIADQGDGMVELSFRDDGRGINPEHIREAAIRSGRLNAEVAKDYTARQLTLLIFEPGFSTKTTVDEDAGRGVGLDAVKELSTRLGGRIRLGSTVGEYCHFRVQLPIHADAYENRSKTSLTKEVA